MGLTGEKANRLTDLQSYRLIVLQSHRRTDAKSITIKSLNFKLLNLEL